MTAPLASYWRKVDFQYGSQPKPRHGHRAVTFKNDMVIFGGGNEGIIEEFSVFRHGKCPLFIVVTASSARQCQASVGVYRLNVNR